MIHHLLEGYRILGALAAIGFALIAAVLLGSLITRAFGRKQ